MRLPEPDPPRPGVSRRDVLRWAGIAGAATLAPSLLAACRPGTTAPPLPPDPSVRPLGFVGGADTVVGPGGWCWFQSPRASVGSAGVLWLGTTVGNGLGQANGAVQATALDTATRAVINQRTLVVAKKDDHTSPSVLALGDRAQVSWALHQANDYLDIGQCTPTGPLATQRIRRPGSVQSPARGTAYASVHVVDGHRWLLYRGESFSWNLLTSPDGTAWTAHGLVVKPGAAGDRPYLHAASDGKRLHVVVTDGNPTEYAGTSVYAGWVEPDLSVHRSDGAQVGTVGSGAPSPKKLTRLVQGIAGADEAGDTDAWLCDLRVVDNRPTGILSVRDPWPVGESSVGSYRHRYLWIRQRSTGWVVEHLGWAGSELFAAQPDYSGLATQDPSEPTRVVVSTDVHPTTGEPLVSAADGLVHHELFEGRRVAEGQWTFTAVTQDSTADNLRPTIAAGGTTKELAWMRGRYWSWTDYNTEIVVRAAV